MKYKLHCVKVMTVIMLFAIFAMPAQAATKIGGLAEEWMNKSGSSLVSYSNDVNWLDNTYGSALNDAGKLQGGESNSVIMGKCLMEWMMEKGSSRYFSIFCDLVEEAYGTYDFNQTKVNLVVSETYGWGNNGGDLAVADEFYLIAIDYDQTDRGGCIVRMRDEIAVRFYKEQGWSSPRIEGIKLYSTIL